MEGLIPSNAGLLPTPSVEQDMAPKVDANAQKVEEQVAEMLREAYTGKVKPIEQTNPMEVYVPEGGAAINLYDDQEDPSDPQGYMILQQEVLILSEGLDMNDPMSVMRGSRVRTLRKSAIRSGKVSDLKQELELLKKKAYPNARIAIVEYLESDAQNVKNMLGEDAFEKRIKRAGSEDDAPDVTKNGERIVRLSVVDYSGTTGDVLQAHDNHEELREYAKIRREERIEANRGFVDAEEELEEQEA